MIYIIEHSTNGTVKTTEDQFITAKFNTVKEARCFVKHIIKCQSVFGFDFEEGSFFQVQELIEGEFENEYKNEGKKIIVK